jgi:LysM repeat protein
MNNPSPFVAEGSRPEPKNKSRTRVKFAVFFVISINVVVLMALLISGCRKPPEAEPPPAETNVLVPDTNAVSADVTAPPTNVVETPAITPLPEAPAPQAHEHAVAQGDSFYTIAKKYGVTMKAIQDANPGVDPKKLQINQKIQVPAATAAPAAPTSLTTSEAPAGSVYIVKSGDTLTKIAADHGTTVKALRSENALTTDKIKVGQKLKIPAKASAPAVTPAPPVMETPAAPPAAPATPPAGQ